MTVTVYSNPGCQPCRLTKMALTKAGIAWEEADAANLPADLAERLQREGHEMTAPVVATSDGQVWTGYRPARIKALVP